MHGARWDLRDATARAPGRRPTPPAAAHHLLGLQRQVGNRAVTALAVQRACGCAGTCGTCAGPEEQAAAPTANRQPVQRWFWDDDDDSGGGGGGGGGDDGGGSGASAVGYGEPGGSGDQPAQTTDAPAQSNDTPAPTPSGGDDPASVPYFGGMLGSLGAQPAGPAPAQGDDPGLGGGDQPYDGPSIGPADPGVLQQMHKENDVKQRLAQCDQLPGDAIASCKQAVAPDPSQVVSPGGDPILEMPMFRGVSWGD